MRNQESLIRGGIAATVVILAAAQLVPLIQTSVTVWTSHPAALYTSVASAEVPFLESAVARAALYSAFVAGLASVLAVATSLPLAWTLTVTGSIRPTRLLLLVLPLLVPDISQASGLFIASSAMGIGKNTAVFVLAETIYVFPFVALALVNGLAEHARAFQQSREDLGLPRATFWLRVAIPFLLPVTVLVSTIGFVIAFNEYTRAFWLAPSTTFASLLRQDYATGTDSVLKLGVYFAIPSALLILYALTMGRSERVAASTIA